MKKRRQRNRTEPLNCPKSGSLNDKNNSNRQRGGYYLAAFVSVVTFAVYLSALRNGFINWDDEYYIITNSNIHSLSVAFFRWAFSSFYVSNWHPLTWLSHALDYATWGLNPLGHHLTNIIIHSINTFIVVLLCIKLSEMWRSRSLPDGSSTFLNKQRTMVAAGVTGLLFGLHPLHVESVAWVAERKDLLCGLFFLLSVSGYAAHIHGLGHDSVQKKALSSVFKKYYLLSLSFFILALMSKPMAVSLPVVLLILDWYPFRRITSLTSFKDACVEKLPFVIFSLISTILTIMAQRTEGATVMMAFVPLRARMLVAANSFVAYLINMAAPVGLSPYYPYPKLQEVTLLSPRYLFAVILVVGITAIFTVAAKKQRLWLSAWGYYAVTLIPVIGIIQVGTQSMADRYTYLPSLGPFFIIGLIAAWVWAKADSLKQWGRMVKGITTTVAVSLVISLSYATLKQIAIWKDGLTLSAEMVRKSPNAAVPHNNLGNAYLTQNRLDEAIIECITALKLNPDFALAHYNLGTAYLLQNRLDEAASELKTTLKLKPDYAEAHHNLGNAYLSQNRPDEAADEFKAALKLKPDLAETHYNLGTAYLQQNRPDEAADEFKAALKLKPDFAMAQTNLAVCYERMKMMKR